MLLFYFCLIVLGIFILIFTLSYKKKLDKNKDILSGETSKNKKTEESNKGKTKQQIELELLLINYNPILKILGVVDKNIKIKLLLILLVVGIYYLFNLGKSLSELSIGIALIFSIIILIPSILTNFILKGKIKKIMVDLPGFIDLVAVQVQTGISIDAALKQVATDLKKLNSDLTYVMLRIIRKSEITGLSQALQDLAISLPTVEIRMFCTVLQQSLNFGSSIYSQLTQLSTDIRELQLLAIEEKLGTLAAKMSIPLILFIMFPIIILILAPGAMRVFPNVF
ncbi:pilus assembly protein TadC [Rodentibacter genomosp. 2]|uniref:type II secretion system F family protein n=1 Tax=Rodentibacter genomosp. 2 TaxID=1908266 RepID=UPI000985F815|nr:pilus assembly protein TadC [Rodentibacter genomosp. 2]